MAVSDAQRKADAKYKRERTTLRGIRFYPADAEVLAWLDAQPNKQGYVKELIRRDMEAHR